MATDPICGMNVDEKTGIKINHNGKDYFFCSEHCKQKFMKENKIENEAPACNHCAPAKKTSIWKNKVFRIAIVYVLIFILGSFVCFFKPLSSALYMYMKTIAFAIILGLLLGGIIDWLIPREYISQLLAQKKKRTILIAVLTGFLMSACSHGILALSIQLYKKGASPPAVVAFLLSSPWANLPLTILMFGFFGIKALMFQSGISHP